MALNWPKKDRKIVAKALRAYPVSSSRCAAAARAILPPATRLDDTARSFHLVPREPSPRLKPKGARVLWYHHVVVESLQHRVDALTGVEGAASSTYLSDYFEFHDTIVETPIDPHTVDPDDPDDDDA